VLDDNCVCDGRALGGRGIDVDFLVDNFGPAIIGVAGDQEIGFAVLNSIFQGRSRKAAEDD
jgi:hypothetical protein